MRLEGSDKSVQAFFALIQAGLWEKETSLQPFGEVDYLIVTRLAEEQSVVGLVTAGLEHAHDSKVHQEVILQLVGQSIQLEQRGKVMNVFVEKLIEQLRAQDIYVILLKGQGIAQSYERPLWRAAGDVDLFLSDSNYSKTVQLLSPLATSVDKEKKYSKHIAMVIDGVDVELHGTMRSGLWKRIDRTLDCIKYDIICGGSVRSWLNGKTQVFLPRADEDIVFVFSHILQHLFKEGVGFRQICDWCRLLWHFRNKINLALLEKRICEMGAMTEWKVLAALTVDYLGMPVEAMPLYSADKKWGRKADSIITYILETGNMGHNRDKSYLWDSPVIKRKLITFWRQAKDNYRLFSVFPLDSLKVLFYYFVSGTKAVFSVNGKE